MIFKGLVHPKIRILFVYLLSRRLKAACDFFFCGKEHERSISVVLGLYKGSQWAPVKYLILCAEERKVWSRVIIVF